MQYKLARLLNTLLIIIAGVIAVSWAGYFLLLRFYPQHRYYYLIGAIFISIGLTVGFVWLEQNWDKRVIINMAKSGKIALANIKSASRLNFMRDSSFNKYWIYEIKADIFDPNHNRIEKTFYEKMSYDTDVIPTGSIYVTYDESKPEQIFIIPNVLIGHIPELSPIVSEYESDKAIRIKYLDAFYNKGMVLRSFKEAINERI